MDYTAILGQFRGVKSKKLLKTDKLWSLLHNFEQLFEKLTFYASVKISKKANISPSDNPK